MRSGPLRADLMFAYGQGKFKLLSELQLHASRSTLSRLPTGTKKPETQKPTTYSRAAFSRKSTRRGLNRPLGSSSPLSASAHGGASRSGTSSHGL